MLTHVIPYVMSLFTYFHIFMRCSVRWSAWSLCEAYAYQHSYRTRNGDLDVYRAANQMLRVTVDGSAMVLYFEPPDVDEKILEREQKQRQAT